VLAEDVLHLLAPRSYYVWPPHFHATFHPDPAALPGVSGESRLTTNGWGIRGSEFSDKDRYRILTVGGSTTECLYLDDSETWPHLLEVRLNGGAFVPGPVWVGNVGKSGHNSSHHVQQAAKLIDQYPRIDMVLVLAGVNDTMPVLRDGRYVPLTDKELRQAFSIQPGGSLEDESYAFYKQTELWRTLRKVRDKWWRDDPGALIQDAAGSVFSAMRARRQRAKFYTDDLPDLSAGVQAYKTNLNMIVDSATQRGAQVILMTQPNLWSAHGTPETERLIWMGRMGRYTSGNAAGYYSSGAMESAMNVYNEALLEVCQARSLQCLDLAAALPKAADVFYDDVHFTEEGSRRVAEIVGAFFERQVSKHSISYAEGQAKAGQ